MAELAALDGLTAASLVAEGRASVALDGETQVVGVPPRHLHTPGREPVILAERHVAGVQYVTFACCTCGVALPERRV